MINLKINDELTLQSYRPGDEQLLFDAVDGSRAHLARWLGWVHDTTRTDHSLQFIEHSLRQAELQEEIALAIWRKEKIIGSVGMHRWDHGTRRAHLGYWLGKEYEGQGIVHQCLGGFIKFLFQDAGLNKLEIRFVTENKKSAKVAERLGFKVEGVLRQAFLRNGLLEDLVVTGLLKDEWKASH